MRHVLSKTLKK